MKNFTIIISLEHLGPRSLLRSQLSICRVSPKIFIHVVDDGEFGMGFLSRAFEEHGFSSYLCNFL
jgi:hypothetical protein